MTTDAPGGVRGQGRDYGGRLDWCRGQSSAGIVADGLRPLLPEKPWGPATEEVLLGGRY